MNNSHLLRPLLALFFAMGYPQSEILASWSCIQKRSILLTEITSGTRGVTFLFNSGHLLKQTMGGLLSLRQDPFPLHKSL
jgi:hypothetical protein